MAECIHYERRPYSELYIGFIVVILIVVGIPACIGLMEFILQYKFCPIRIEEANATVGGTTICECFVKIITCGKSHQT